MYLKASNAEAYDDFGTSVAISPDGTSVAVGAVREDSPARGVNGTQTNGTTSDDSGAAYLFVRANGVWSQQAFLKASNTHRSDNFGRTLAFSGDGVSLVVGADGEHSDGQGINGDQTGTNWPGAGAAYVFTRTGVTWAQRAYAKASQTETNSFFSAAVALSGDGNELVAGAPKESSNATTVNGDDSNTSATSSGAAYWYRLP